MEPGGWVNSQLFDHTSLIRFLEARFADHHPRSDRNQHHAVAARGRRRSDHRVRLQDAERVAAIRAAGHRCYKPEDLVRHPDEVPVPPAEASCPGRSAVCVRLGDSVHACTLRGAAQPADGSFRIELRNAGQAGAVFQVRSGNAADAPRSYTVEPHKQLIDTWRIDATAAPQYDLAVYGPNGFFCGFKGTCRAANAATSTSSRPTTKTPIPSGWRSRIAQHTRRGSAVVNTYRSRSMTSVLGAGDTDSKSWSLSATGGWYDLVITVEGDPHFEYRLAGHLENGEDSISDPAMGGLV